MEVRHNRPRCRTPNWNRRGPARILTRKKRAILLGWRHYKARDAANLSSRIEGSLTTSVVVSVTSVKLVVSPGDSLMMSPGRSRRPHISKVPLRISVILVATLLKCADSCSLAWIKTGGENTSAKPHSTRNTNGGRSTPSTALIVLDQRTIKSIVIIHTLFDRKPFFNALAAGHAHFHPGRRIECKL